MWSASWWICFLRWDRTFFFKLLPQLTAHVPIRSSSSKHTPIWAAYPLRQSTSSHWLILQPCVGSRRSSTENTWWDRWGIAVYSCSILVYLPVAFLLCGCPIGCYMRNSLEAQHVSSAATLNKTKVFDLLWVLVSGCSSLRRVYGWKQATYSDSEILWHICFINLCLFVKLWIYCLKNLLNIYCFKWNLCRDVFCNFSVHMRWVEVGSCPSLLITHIRRK